MRNLTKYCIVLMRRYFKQYIIKCAKRCHTRGEAPHVASFGAFYNVQFKISTHNHCINSTNRCKMSKTLLNYSLIHASYLDLYMNTDITLFLFDFKSIFVHQLLCIILCECSVIINGTRFAVSYTKTRVILNHMLHHY